MKLNRSNGGAARRLSMLAIACVGLVLGACTTMGTGMGTTSPGGEPVSLAWTSRDDALTGTMSATLPGGAAFTGPFLEMTNTSRVTELDPMWNGWTPGWYDWDWGADVTTTDYSGRVVANLQGPNSQRMRCHLRLNDPSSGMIGGGQGKCQVAGGATIDAVFPRV